MMKLWDRFTPREAEVAELLLTGMDWVTIADYLGIARRTMKAHASRLYLKCGIYEDPKKLQYIQLAVMLTYERWPELVPRNAVGVGAR
jgi:DNA-binding NarL/FixJ family response regulator